VAWAFAAVYSEIPDMSSRRERFWHAVIVFGRSPNSSGAGSTARFRGSLYLDDPQAFSLPFLVHFDSPMRHKEYGLFGNALVLANEGFFDFFSFQS
jgi:hypothetical protein